MHDIERMLNKCDVTCVRNGSASSPLPTCASMHGVSGFRRKYLRQHGRSAFTRSHRTRTTVRSAVFDVLSGLCLWMRSCTQNQCHSTSHASILASVRFVNIGQYYSIPQYRPKLVRFVNIASVRQAILTRNLRARAGDVIEVTNCGNGLWQRLWAACHACNFDSQAFRKQRDGL